MESHKLAVTGKITHTEVETVSQPDRLKKTRDRLLRYTFAD